MDLQATIEAAEAVLDGDHLAFVVEVEESLHRYEINMGGGSGGSSC